MYHSIGSRKDSKINLQGGNLRSFLLFISSQIVPPEYINNSPSHTQKKDYNSPPHQNAFFDIVTPLPLSANQFKLQTKLHSNALKQ